MGQFPAMTGTADTYRSFHEIVRDSARLFPERVYVHSIDQDKDLSYGDLHRIGNRLAHFLRSEGFAANDRLLLLAENSVETVAMFVGVLRYGATLATANVEMNRAHLAEIIGAVAPRIVVYQEGLDLEALGASCPGARWVALGEWEPGNAASTGLFADLAGLSDKDDVPSLAQKDDFAVIFYTSGTVAKPKGVIQTHATAFYNYDATADYVGMNANDRLLDFRSLSWLSAQHIALGAPLTRGATLILAHRFSQSRYFEWIKTYGATVAVCNPTGINMLINRPVAFVGGDAPKFRFMTSSSAPLLAEQWKKFEDMYAITVAQSYGSSEGGNTAAHRGADRKIGTIGPPLKYQTIRIVDGEGNRVAQGEAGEIIVGGGKQQAYGYLLEDGSVERLPADGYHSGDLGLIDDEGHVRITGRVKDVIIRGGVNIAPLEVDGVLMAHPDIAEAATVGVPDPIYGEEVVSYVALMPGARLSAQAVIGHCGEKLPEFKMPKEIIFRETMPKTTVGKLDRNALVDDWKQSHQAK